MDNEIAIAELMARDCHSFLRYSLALGWLTQAPGRTHWVSGGDLHAFERARIAVKSVATPPLSAATMRALLKAKTVYGVAALARSDARIVCTPADFDVHPYELNTPAGVVDLRDGSIRARGSGELFLHCTAVAPGCGTLAGTRFGKFLQEITLNDAALIAYLRRMLGACLFASNILDDHWFAFLIGAGRNGKGTLIEGCAAAAMGNYAVKIPANVLMAQDHGERHSTELMDLMGARLAYSNEVPPGAAWNLARLKELSGGDTIRARRMRQDSTEFPPTHRLVIGANSRPRVRAVDFAFAERCRLVPFNATFRRAEQGTSLRTELAAELPTVLAWMIGGANEWYETGRLHDCDAVTAASAGYMEEQDDIGLFVAEACELDSQFDCTAGDLLRKFNQWKEQRNEREWSARAFGDAMTSAISRGALAGVERVRRTAGHVYVGMRPKPPGL